MKVNTHIWKENERIAAKLTKKRKWGETINQHLKAVQEAEKSPQPLKSSWRLEGKTLHLTNPLNGDDIKPLTKKAK